jgi:dTDP-4-amino-4,6-dideoxygalactose transaminase
MNELEAAIGIGAMEVYQEILKKRHDNLIHVLERFGSFAPFLSTIEEAPHEKIGPHAIPIIVNEGAPFSRAELTRHLEERGIETRTLFASMPTQCPGFSGLGYQLGEFPNAEYLGHHGLHVGVHQDLSLEDMDYLLNSIDEFVGGFTRKRASQGWS